MRFCPVFLVSVLGASVAAVGLLEGTAEAIASITKVFSGTLSDWLGKRKLLTVVGYGLAALTKPLFALAPSARLGVCGARPRPHRQRHSRRAARRADRRPHAGPDPRRGVRLAADARHDRRVRGPAARDRTDGGDGRFVSHGVLARRDPGAVSVVVLVLFVREPSSVESRRTVQRLPLAALLGTLGCGGTDRRLWQPPGGGLHQRPRRLRHRPRLARSLAATAVFMATAVATVFVTRHFFGM